MPIGSDAFVAGHLQALLDATELELMSTTRREPQLPVQDHLLLLRRSIHPRFAHLACTIPAVQVVCGIHYWGRRLRTVVAGMVVWDVGGGSAVDTLLALPTRYGGLGLSGWTEDRAAAAFLAAVLLAHDALEGGAPAFQPCAQGCARARAYGAQLGARWANLRPLGP
jgi:hypothetical protein